jgi:hypothetical protein
MSLTLRILLAISLTLGALLPPLAYSLVPPDRARAPAACESRASAWAMPASSNAVMKETR